MERIVSVTSKVKHLLQLTRHSRPEVFCKNSEKVFFQISQKSQSTSLWKFITIGLTELIIQLLKVYMTLALVHYQLVCSKKNDGLYHTKQQKEHKYKQKHL